MQKDFRAYFIAAAKIEAKKKWFIARHTVSRGGTTEFDKGEPAVIPAPAGGESEKAVTALLPVGMLLSCADFF